MPGFAPLQNQHNTQLRFAKMHNMHKVRAAIVNLKRRLPAASERKTRRRMAGMRCRVLNKGIT